jgi:hypothetical protein
MWRCVDLALTDVLEKHITSIFFIVTAVKTSNLIYSELLAALFMEPSDYYDAPIDKVLHFIRSVGLIKG